MEFNEKIKEIIEELKEEFEETNIPSQEVVGYIWDKHSDDFGKMVLEAFNDGLDNSDEYSW